MVLKFNKQRWLTKVSEVLQNYGNKLHDSHISILFILQDDTCNQIIILLNLRNEKVSSVVNKFSVLAEISH